MHVLATGYPGRRISLKGPGIFIAGGDRVEQYGGKVVTYRVQEGDLINIVYHECDVERPIVTVGCMLRQGYKTTVED